VDTPVDGVCGMAWLRRSATAAAALAVAVQQQPHGTLEARELAVAAGQALLQQRRGISVYPAELELDGTVLCHDTVARVIEALWPPLPEAAACLEAARTASTSSLSPRTFETRLRSAARVLRDLQQVSAVSPAMAKHANRGGWPATHAYLYQEAGTKGELRHRYAASVQRLLVRDRLLRSGGGEEGLVARVLGFLSG